MVEIEHIFFDLDHTLWDFEKNSALTFQEILPELNIHIDLELFLKTYVPINSKYWKKYRNEQVTKKELKYLRLEDTFNTIGHPIKNIVIHKLSEKYISRLPNHNHLFEGAHKLLQYLQTKYQLHIITNGFEETQTLKMKRSEILPFFNQIITSDAVGAKKPSPKIFEYALKKANASASSSIMIGDNLEADIEGARNCGMKTIHFNSQKALNVPSHITSIAHLEEIKQFL